MKARIIDEGNDGANNGGVKWKELCVEGVHLTIAESWFDHGCKETREVTTKIDGACAGRCSRTQELDREQIALVRKFQRTGKRGEIKHESEHVFEKRESPPRKPRQG